MTTARTRMNPMRASLWRGLAVSAVALATSMSMPLAQAATELAELPPPAIVVDSAGGNQTNPSVSGDLVVYTDQSNGSHVRYRSLVAGGPDGVVPNPDGKHHHLSDVDGTRIVFTQIDGAGASRIMLYDVSTPEVAPVSVHDGIVAGRHPSLGGSTVVFHDLSFAPGGFGTEVSVVDMGTGTLTRLSDDDEADMHPAVSPDGATVAWTKCAGGNYACDIWMARKAEGWTPRPVSGSPTEESLPSLDNTTIVYASRPSGAHSPQDLVAVPIDGGGARTLALGVTVKNPNISGGVVSAEIQRQAGGAFDVILWELDADRYRYLTDTPESEFLNELYLGDDGRLRVVWTVFINGSDIHAAIVDLGGLVETSLVAQPVLRPGAGNKKSDRALEARLTRADTGAGVPDAEVTFRAGTAVCVVRTDVAGVGRCVNQSAFSSAVSNDGYTVEFAGQPGVFGASQASGARLG